MKTMKIKIILLVLGGLLVLISMGLDWISPGATAPESVVIGGAYDLMKVLAAGAVIILGSVIFLTRIIFRRAVRPIVVAADYIQVLAVGDFTGEIPPVLLTRKDETGRLANAIHSMQNFLRAMFKEVRAESAAVSETLANINSSMEQLNQNMEEISSIIEGLSAGTEETAASTEEMNATSIEVERAVETMAKRAQEGAAVSAQVCKMSEHTRDKSLVSKEETSELYHRVRSEVQRAMEQAKAVEQINELSATILEITSQTNLLALNAAIEAARAGEAGRGFAVVADEIGKLAEGSSNSVAKIQEVTGDILQAFNALTSSTAEIMTFIEQKVLADYSNLVKIGQRYNDNSKTMNDVVMDFSAASEELWASIGSMVQAIEQISQAANEEAIGAANIAQEASKVTLKSYDIIQLAGSAKEKSDSLVSAVMQFKI